VSQTGVQDEPSRVGTTQSPTPAFATTGKEAQLEEAHDPAADQTEAVQVAVTVPKKPELHVKEQELPVGAFALQVPGPAFATEGKPAQLLLTQEPLLIQLL